MSAVIDAIVVELQSIKSELIKKYREKGMKASGKWEATLNIQMTNISGAIFGQDYTEYLEHGQPAGIVENTDSFRKVIEQWIIDKKIQSDTSVSSLAFLIARKIANQGWDRADYGGVNLISEVLTPQRIQQMFDRLGKAVGVEYAEWFKKLETV